MIVPQAKPLVLVIFGGTGDLFRRKLAPSLYTLFEEKLLPENLLVIGTGRSNHSDADYRKYTREAVEEILGINAADSFTEHFTYVQGEVQSKELFNAITRVIAAHEATLGVDVRVCWYCSIGSNMYEPIAKGISSHTTFLNREESLNSFLIEKPIGHNLQSSIELNKRIGVYFKESQITRIEHYLTKETLQRIPEFLNMNPEITSILNGDCVEHIEVDFHETIGVEKRGGFYDTVGALRDVGQNHMLEMLALTSMDIPENCTKESVRDARVSFLDEFSKEKSIAPKARRYQHNGYSEIEGVAPGSMTETAFEIIDTMPATRWKSIPCIFRGGKRLEAKKKSIFFLMKSDVSLKGRLIHSLCISIDPECVFFNYQNGETEIFQFRPNHQPKYQYVEEYSKILNAAFQSSQEFSVSSEEVTLLWKITDKYTMKWDTMNEPLNMYDKGSLPFNK